jgi:hypothetical protein
MPFSSPDDDLAPYLESNERLLWAGKPGSGIRFRSQDSFMIPFSLLWCGFAIFWTYGASRNAPVFFWAWGLMFVAIGLYFVFGRFVTDAITRSKAAYGITDRRVLILSGFASRELKALNLKAIPEIALSIHRNATGTITFGSAGGNPFGSVRGWPGSSKTMPPAFEFIQQPQEAYRLVMAQQRA